jgi:cell wall-associated NlpC family hydrolase
MTIHKPAGSVWKLTARCIFASLLALSISDARADEPAPVTISHSTKLEDLTNRASELALRAMGMLGIRYKRGGTTPENGLDCSGLVGYVFKEAWGATLPRTAVEISALGQHIDRDDLQPGDLVFYNTLKRGFSHVGIYLGDNRFIHSPSSGGEVRIENMGMAYWTKRFNGARRMQDPQQTIQ